MKIEEQREAEFQEYINKQRSMRLGIPYAEPEKKLEYKYRHLIVNARRCGNTTRFIDQFIQDLFIHKEVTIFDHYDTAKPMATRLNQRIAEIIIVRLEYEHHIKTVYSKKKSERRNVKHAYFNSKTFTFKLVE